MKYKVLLIIITLLGCNVSDQNPHLEKETDLKGYFKDSFDSKISTKDELIIILNNQNCSSCRKDVIKTLVEKVTRSTSHKTYILMKEDSMLVSAIKKDLNSIILIDTSGKADKYGLNYASDFIYLFKSGKLTEKLEISNKSVLSL